MPLPSLTSRDKLLLGIGVSTISGVGLAISSLVLWRRLNKTTAAYTDLSREVAHLRSELDEVKGKVGIQETAKRKNYGQTQTRRSTDARYFFDNEQRSGPSSQSGDEMYLSADEFLGDDSLEAVYDRVDLLLKDPQIEHRHRAFQMLKSYLPREQKNAPFLWRLARATYLYAQMFVKIDEEKRKELCYEAKTYAYEAERIEPQNADVQKWCALTVGTLTDYLPVSEKIKNGHVFKMHIDKAIEQKPEDCVLHHLKGRWCHAVANLSWIERKVASALFGSPPEATYEQALHHFLKADEYSTEDWAENSLFIAKTFTLLGNRPEALVHLRKAGGCFVKTPDDTAAREEARQLLNNY